MVQATVRSGYEKLLYLGVCLSVYGAILRREAPGPRSSTEWAEIRLKVYTHTVRHRATVARAGKSLG
jgi:hypothetical protein